MGWRDMDSSATGLGLMGGRYENENEISVFKKMRWISWLCEDPLYYPHTATLFHVT
jgi:hypothetical protein